MKITFVFIILIGLAAHAQGQTSAFTYQGKLTDGGTPSNGTYDLTFRLYDMQNGGSQIGPDQVKDDVTASNGIFKVVLDFGRSPFTSNTGNFLEISVRPGASTGGFTMLAPRQPITSSPYAVQTIRAETAAIADNANALGGTSAASFVQTTDSRLSDARPPTAGSANYIQNGTGVQPLSNFNVSGNGTVGGTMNAGMVNTASQFRIGGSNFASNPATATTVVGDTPAHASAAVQNSFFGYAAGASIVFGKNNSFFGLFAGQGTTSGDANSFFGASSGAANVDGMGNTGLGSEAGSANTSGDFNVFVGIGSGSGSSTGNFNTFVGTSTGIIGGNGDNNTALGSDAKISGSLSNATAIGWRASATTANSLVLGAINGVNGATANTNIGVGTTAPSFRFHVRANGQDGIKIQHTGTGLFPQIRWTDSADVFKASIGVDTSGAGSMNFFVNGSDRMVIENNGLVRTPGGIFIANPSTLVITSPNGACWGITVSNAGVLGAFSTPCP